MQSQKIVAVLDTNILISAWISGSSIPGIIFKRFQSGDFELITSNTQLNEISEVIQRPRLKKYLKKKEALIGINHLKSGRSAKIHTPKKHIWSFPDIKDHFLLDLISEEEVNFLVTGDKLLLSFDMANF